MDENGKLKTRVEELQSQNTNLYKELETVRHTALSMCFLKFVVACFPRESVFLHLIAIIPQNHVTVNMLVRNVYKINE